MEGSLPPELIVMAKAFAILSFTGKLYRPQANLTDSIQQSQQKHCAAISRDRMKLKLTPLAIAWALDRSLQTPEICGS